jgi:hypothetical protein
MNLTSTLCQMQSPNFFRIISIVLLVEWEQNWETVFDRASQLNSFSFRNQFLMQLHFQFAMPTFWQKIFRFPWFSGQCVLTGFASSLEKFFYIYGQFPAGLKLNTTYPHYWLKRVSSRSRHVQKRDCSYIFMREDIRMVTFIIDTSCN